MKPIRQWNKLALCGGVLLAIYWYLVMQITGASPANFVIIRNLSQSADITWIPFCDLTDVLGTGDVLNIALQIGGNVALFGPLGFLVPACWPGWRSFGRVAALGFGMSLFIEVNQLFNWRASTADDLILNTLGAVLGYLCYRLAAWLVPALRRRARGLPPAPVYIMLAVWALCTAKELYIYLVLR